MASISYVRRYSDLPYGREGEARIVEFTRSVEGDDRKLVVGYLESGTVVTETTGFSSETCYRIVRLRSARCEFYRMASLSGRRTCPATSGHMA